jgi:hypothetical protein
MSCSKLPELLDWRALLCLLLAAIAAGARAVDAPTDNDVKAVFVYNFSRFVAWPDSASSGPFVIGILGHDELGTRLDEAVRGESLNNRPLVVRRFQSIDEIGDCQILFIDRSESAELGHVLSTLTHRSTLTVSDMPDAADHGVMIQFVTENSRIRLRINVDSARSAGLTISSNLLRPAEIVGKGSGT